MNSIVKLKQLNSTYLSLTQDFWSYKLELFKFLKVLNYFKWNSTQCFVCIHLQVTKKLKMGGGERYNIPAPQSRNVSKNQQQLSRQKTKDQNSQMKIVHKKKERGHTYNSSAAAWQAMQSGGKNKNFPNNQNWNSSLSSPTLLFKSQTNQNYAGAKFSEPPSPSVLPKPPSHWVPVSFNPSDKEIMTFQLKTLLKVQV